ncbi:MAG: hypothetical protein BMS9Abin23_0515 [Thermodesulfobacteriota bacterium]|nr:MAG: hypothetical protein BMS9Abin23_0515 [Thermodesulfobacteriota bacterium]
MSKRKKIIFGVLFLVFSLFILSSEAAASWGKEITLKKANPEIEAKGTVYIRFAGFVPSDRFIEIDVFHLKPGGVYSVWIVDSWSGKREALGIVGENYFKADAAGFGHFADHTTEYILGWNMLEVAYHPDGDPSNTGDMKVVLKARLYQ